jgi:hypothetical protein
MTTPLLRRMNARAALPGDFRRGSVIGTLKLTPQQRTFFRERGYLRLERAMTREHLRAVQAYVADNLSRNGINASGKGVPRSISDLPVFQQIGKLSQLIKPPDVPQKLVPSGLLATIESLAASRITSAQTQFLISPSKQGDWSLTKLNWHTDISSPAGAAIPGIQAFIIVRDVESRGGATLALAGSHLQMGNEKTSSRIREALRNGSDGEGALRDLNLAVVEFCGRAGDVYLMDMRMLHTPSINTSNRLRIVVTVRWFVA